ncbi:terminase [Novosphingobium lindaniclasticum LE124]|uniref:Terminase n=2 Tax=Novosphingobium TaxID=165696 RepID=T0H029_9SPHN|nr:terminase [Novosphingobium lindaniclasticum LE124]
MAALAAAAVDPKQVVSSDKGGQPSPAPADRTPAMIYRERAAATAIVSAPEGAVTAENRIAAEIALRFTHDLRRLKEIRSIDRKIEAKREMLPDYAAWIEGLLAADAGAGNGTVAEVLPTCMVWFIDIGEFDQALDLVPFIFRHNVAMPARYQRDAATIVVEEIAEAALKQQNAGKAFPLDVLTRTGELTDDLDIHDEVRAKLLKAIGIEQLRVCEGMVAEDSAEGLAATIATFREAQRLHDRIGVKDRVKRAEKLLAAVTAAAPPADTGGIPAA